MERSIPADVRMTRAGAGGRAEAMEQDRGRSPLAVLRSRNFRLLWIGEGLSMVGDQFYLIALPWLVLQLTGSAFAMGTVLALAGVPRALFMLLGGALTDRFSARALMLVSTTLRLILVAMLATLVMVGLIELWMLYVFALVFGLADAFFYPAQTAIVPRLVDQELLPPANALLQGTGQLSMFAGPVLAGLLIAILDGGTSLGVAASQTVPDMWGIGVAFSIDALSFLFPMITLRMMQFGKAGQGMGQDHETADMVSSILEGLKTAWNDAPLRAFFLMVAAINFLVTGPFAVGIPVLADSRLPEGAAAFGMIMSAFGGGSLAGTALAGLLPRPSREHTTVLLLGVTAAMGVGLAVFGLSSSTAADALVAVLMGAANGYVVIFFITWLQVRTAPAMLGRTMSLLMFAVVGLSPVSTALAGALVNLNPTVLFVSAGAAMSVVVVACGLSPAVREMGLEIRETAPAA